MITGDVYYAQGIVYPVLLLIFVVLTLFVGRKRGILMLLAIGLTGMILWWGMFPLLARMYNPILVSLFAFLAVIALCLPLITGLNRISLSAFLAASCGIAFSAVLAYYLDLNYFHFTGFDISKGEWLIKSRFADRPDIFSKIVVAGVIMGALGAIMDVAVSIASSVNELKVKAPDISRAQAINSGFRVGGDIVGTMANTLIFAYLGAQIALLLSPYLKFNGMWHKPFLQLINGEGLSVEIARGLIGSIGLVLTFPLVALLSGALLGKRGKMPGLKDLFKSLGRKPVLNWRRSLSILSCLILLAVGYRLFDGFVAASYYVHSPDLEVVRARVIAQQPIYRDPELDVDFQPTKYQILSGSYKGKELLIQEIAGRTFNWIDPAVGARQLLTLHHEGDRPAQATVRYFERDRVLLCLAFLLLGLVILLGQSKGVRTAAALLVSCGILFGVFMPLLANGWPPLLLFSAVAGVLTGVTFFLVGGLNRKSISGILATLITLALIGGICYGAVRIARLDGVGIGIRYIIKNWSTGASLNFQQLLICGMLLGMLGAMMDLCMTIVSSMSEIQSERPEIAFRDLAASGMAVGRKVMGMMTVTLLFAYAGAELSAFLLLSQAAPGPLVKPITYYYYAEIIIRVLIGSIGLVVAVPVTTFVAGKVLLWKRKGT